MLGRAGPTARRAAIAAALAAAALAGAPSAAAAAGPTAIATDSDGTVYAGFASGAVKRYRVSDGVALTNWTTPVADANGSLGGIMAIDVAPGSGIHNGGNVWILDANRRVQEFTRSGDFVRGLQVDACDGSNNPVPGTEGGLDVAADSIYVAHPCGNRLLRYSLASLILLEAEPNVFGAHGIAAPLSATAHADTQFLYVAQPSIQTIRRYDLASLDEVGTVGITHSCEVEDVHLSGIGGEGRILLAESSPCSAGSSYADKITAVDPPLGPTSEIFNFGGTGTAPTQLNDPVAFDALSSGGATATDVVIADRGNERVQRLSATAANNGNLGWVSPAPDPGPPLVPSTGGTGGAGDDAGGGSAGVAGAPAVSINGDARYTKTPNVILTIREPAGSTDVEIANNGDFSGLQARVPTPTLSYDWTLDTEGSDRVARRVFVRFPGTADGGVVSDEITLDRRAPLVGEPTIEKKRRPDRKGRRWKLRVPADDEVSGVDRLEYGPERGGEFKSRSFKSPLRVMDRSDALYVRVTDVAGNLSAVKRVFRDRR